MALRTAPPARPGRRSPLKLLVLIVLGFGLLIFATATGLSLLRGDDSGGPSRPSDPLVPADVERNTPVAQPPPLDGGPGLATWTAGTAARTGIPLRAVQAYAAAEIAQRVRTPRCQLSWVTLAGIGRVESAHGRIDGSHLDADGVARPAIIGLPLDGTNGTREIRDTDAGALDGDTTFDRAVGPMQFLPSTWARFGADGNGDGVRDPNQLDDAARGAAAYLCSGGRNTADGTGWWDGVLSYNRSLSYGRLVWAAAARYAS